jgi:hypothetical protein
MGEREPTLPFYPLMAKNVTIRPVLIYTMPERAQDEGAADVLRLCEAARSWETSWWRWGRNKRPFATLSEKVHTSAVTGNAATVAARWGLLKARALVIY